MSLDHPNTRPGSEPIPFLARTFDLSPLGVCFFDPHRAIQWANKAIAQQLGLPIDRLVGKPAGAALPGWTDQMGQIYDQVRDTGIGWHGTLCPYAFPDQPHRGTTYWNSTVIPLKSQHGEFQGWLLLHDEVTDHVRGERKIEYLLELAQQQNEKLALQSSSLAAQNLALQTQAAELNAQAEELQAQSEEIQLQNEELRKQEAELRVQNEVLHAQAEEIAAQAEELSAANESLIRARRVLELAEEEHRLLIENIPHGILLTAPDGSILSANAAAEGIFGLDAENICRLGRAGLVDTSDPRLAVFLETRSHSGRALGELTLRRGDGETFPAAVASVVFKDSMTRERTSLMIHDLTQIKRAQEAVARLAAIVESSEDAIVGKSLDGVITSWNAAAERLYGYSAAEIVGKSVLVLSPPERLDELADILLRISRRERVPRFETLRIRKDGSPVNVSIVVSPIVDSNGALLGASTIARDITERIRHDAALKAIEESLRTTNHDLEARVRQRTAALSSANEELRLEIVERRRAQDESAKNLATVRSVFEGTVQAIASAMDIRDPYTAGHQRRVAQLAYAIAEHMGLSTEQLDAVWFAALIHDIGKISVPSEILSKPGQVSVYEREIIKSHAQVGHDILDPIHFPWPVADIVLQHHERLDGSGYPASLPGGLILPEARILAVADVVEAMATHRPYRPALGVDAALEEVAEQSGVLYDPHAVRACVRLFKEHDFQFSDQSKQGAVTTLWP